jgi:hypothetical protein
MNTTLVPTLVHRMRSQKKHRQMCICVFRLHLVDKGSQHAAKAKVKQEDTPIDVARR